MALARVVAVAPGSPAAGAGVRVGDEILAMNGGRPRDVLEYQQLAAEPLLHLDLQRGHLEVQVEVERHGGEALGIEVHSALFDQVRTCDNHCEFCFIYQLPPGMRKSLYLKDDDYRLSFLYGNYTTLTRFTEADLERVITEGLSPLNVSIHATDPDVRSEMLRNRRGATSLRWLRALLDHDIEVHGQLVVCPGVNDGAVLDDTFAGVLDKYPELATLCVVPLGVSRHTAEGRLRPHTRAEANAVLDAVHDWQDVYRATLGRRLAFAADEYYLLTGRPFPPAEHYEGFPMYEDGVGMARQFQQEYDGLLAPEASNRPGFFEWVDAAPADGYRAVRQTEPSAPAPAVTSVPVTLGSRPRPRARADAPVAVLTGELGATVLAPLVERCGRDDVRIIVVTNEYFGGNIGVAGLLVGDDLHRALAGEPDDHRFLLPDVCLSEGRFLDGLTPDDLPRPVEVLPTDGAALRAALER
jgi:putative radical SAM enzyme (TIGR03279 family)